MGDFRRQALEHVPANEDRAGSKTCASHDIGLRHPLGHLLAVEKLRVNEHVGPLSYVDGAQKSQSFRRHVGAIREFFQALAIENGDLAAARGDQARLLQSLHGDCHAGRWVPSIRPRNSCVRGNSSLSTRSSAMRSQRANRLSMLLRPFVERGRCRLEQERVDIAEQGAVQGAALGIRLPQIRRADAKASASNLGERRVLGAITS